MSAIMAALETAAERFTDRIAVSGKTTRYDYLALRDAVAEAARRLHDAPRPVLVSPTSEPEDVVCVLAAMVAGRVPMIVDPVWKRAELVDIAGSTGAGHLLTRCDNGEGLVPVTDEWLGRQVFSLSQDADSTTLSNPRPDILPDEVVVGRFTSGTTGASRCLGFSENAVLGAAAAWSDAADLTPDDVVFCLATMNNGLAFNTSLLSVLTSGAHLALHQGRPIPSSIRRAVRDVGATVLVAFPFVFDELVKTDLTTFAGLRLAVSSAAPLDPVTAQRWAEQTGVPVCNYYGLAEVGPITFNRGDVAGSLGRCLVGASVRTGARDEHDTGSIAVRTGWMASRYLDRRAPFLHERVDADGYYRTNDLGRVVDGRLFVSGRADEVVNIAGRKIDPTEVAAVIRDLEQVTDVVVRGEGADTSRVLAAYVESVGLDRSAVLTHCRAHLADYKLPQRVVIVPRLPRTSTGKVHAGALRDLVDGART